MREFFWAGFRRTLPFQTGVIPFGLLYATLASAAGFSWWITLLLTVVVYGGSSQLVFIDLLRHLGSPLQAVLGANIVNARHLIYSAGVSRFISPLPGRWRALLGYLLTDQMFAVAEAEREVLEKRAPLERAWYLFGCGVCTWSFWLAANVAGLGFGHVIPRSWNLGFSIPLIFMPLVIAVTPSRPAALAVGAAALFTMLLRDLPYGLGVFAAILLAAGLGFASRRWIEGGRR